MYLGLLNKPRAELLKDAPLRMVNFALEPARRHPGAAQALHAVASTVAIRKFAG